MRSGVAVKTLLQLRKGADSRIGADRIDLLEIIGRSGSIAAAAKTLDISYKGAWDAVQALNNLFERPLVVAHPGGRAGGEAVITPAGEAVIRAFRRLESEMGEAIQQLERSLAGQEGAFEQVVWSLNMKTSARNTFRGVVRRIDEGAVNTEVVLRISDGVEIVAVVTRESVAALGLAVGAPVMALIKSSFVILARADEAVRTSARNSLTGVVVRHADGAVNDEVVIDLGEGKTITTTVTRHGWRELELAVGDRATALIKASHVILAVD
jgi:molybdate transport system regulatory protein